MKIRPVPDGKQRRVCAVLMAESEPWLTLGLTLRDCAAIVGDPSKEMYLAEIGGVIAGYILIQMAGVLRGYIQIVVVKPECRGKGVGRGLLRFAQKRIFRDEPNVFICVSSFNRRARKLYESAGFAVIGELKDYLVRGHSELVLRKTIGPRSEFRPKR